jgi:hypothetical protein
MILRALLIFLVLSWVKLFIKYYWFDWKSIILSHKERTKNDTYFKGYVVYKKLEWNCGNMDKYFHKERNIYVMNWK